MAQWKTACFASRGFQVQSLASLGAAEKNFGKLLPLFVDKADLDGPMVHQYKATSYDFKFCPF